MSRNVNDFVTLPVKSNLYCLNPLCQIETTGLSIEQEYQDYANDYGIMSAILSRTYIEFHPCGHRHLADGSIVFVRDERTGELSWG